MRVQEGLQRRFPPDEHGEKLLFKVPDGGMESLERRLGLWTLLKALLASQALRHNQIDTILGSSVT